MDTAPGSPRKAPVVLRRALDIDRLVASNPCDSVRLLGSYWPYSRTCFESHIVKSFKECYPARDFEPHISALCAFYASLAAEACRGRRFEWVARVLSSAEREPEESRPQQMLANAVCRSIGARNATHVFFKAQSRPSMRTVKRLSGPDALEARVRYVIQDLFIRPCELGGSVLLLDDIYNVGASMRVYAQALKEFAGAECVFGVNLAATRFSAGRDGHGMLRLDLSRLPDEPGLAQVWRDAAGVFHGDRECPSAKPPVSCGLRFIVERNAPACKECVPRQSSKRKWWQIFGC